eukprot:2053961-Amphidinium_carterae.1
MKPRSLYTVGWHDSTRRRHVNFLSGQSVSFTHVLVYNNRSSNTRIPNHTATFECRPETSRDMRL